MGKTIKRLPSSCVRSPRGKKQALQARENGKIRNKAIPPDAWDDKPYDKQAYMPYTIAWKMFKDGKSEEQCFKTLTKKYKLSSRDANEIIRDTYKNDRI